ncbi:MAG: homoserine kinase [Methylacidiphilales bacterium]|nr:homoserine kinase [Candidatus Methylacidiphilales bacterium]
MSNTVSVRVPATTANIGPGFDTLGVALELYNTITISPGAKTWPDAFMQEAAHEFFLTAEIKPEAFSVQIAGDVPPSRGLGSSVTVRLGIIAALNKFHGSPLDREKILDLVIGLEGHPDNAVPAFHGGFAVSTRQTYAHVPVSPELKFVAVIPDYEVETKEARKVLPADVSLEHAVENIQYSGLIVLAFATSNYELLRGAFRDHLHQPYRSKLIPACEATFDAAEDAGALGAFISGSGSTLMAVTLDNPEAVANAMKQALTGAGAKNLKHHVLNADNQGVVIL